MKKEVHVFMDKVALFCCTLLSEIDKGKTRNYYYVYVIVL